MIFSYQACFNILLKYNKKAAAAFELIKGGCFLSFLSLCAKLNPKRRGEQVKKFDKTPLFARADIIIILLVTLLALLSVFFVFGGNSSANRVVVKVAGNVYAEYSLQKSGEYQISGEDGITLTLVVGQDGVYVKHADCPDKLCEKTGRISGAGQNIICLPGKISVALEGASQNVDAEVG